MSRIGNRPLTLPDSVKLEISKDKLVFTGPKGSLTVPAFKSIKASLEDNILSFKSTGKEKSDAALHGLVRSLSKNAIEGVTEGFSRGLELVGTGYRVSQQAATLVFSVGFSHPVTFHAVPGISWAVEGTNKVKVSGIDKQLVGQVAANIRKIRPPEPYKGKGIRFTDEIVRRKAGKSLKAEK
ncbi:50S ribosomal protein L6 [Candidatus Collierbacteria bacterium]|nr:50S ribosomal protein L6 [Candidatus Collierbacteria bacterium]